MEVFSENIDKKYSNYKKNLLKKNSVQNSENEYAKK